MGCGLIDHVDYLEGSAEDKEASTFNLSARLSDISNDSA